MNNESMACRQLFGDLGPNPVAYQDPVPDIAQHGVKRIEDLDRMPELPAAARGDGTARNESSDESSTHVPKVSYSSLMMASLLMAEEDELDEGATRPREPARGATGESIDNGQRRMSSGSDMSSIRIESKRSAEPSSSGPRARLMFGDTPAAGASAPVRAAGRGLPDSAQAAGESPEVAEQQAPVSSSRRRQRFRRRRRRQDEGSAGVSYGAAAASASGGRGWSSSSSSRRSGGLRSGPAPRRALDMSAAASGRRRGGARDHRRWEGQEEESKSPEHGCDEAALLSMSMDSESENQTAGEAESRAPGGSGAMLAALRGDGSGVGDDSGMDVSGIGGSMSSAGGMFSGDGTSRDASMLLSPGEVPPTGVTSASRSQAAAADAPEQQEDEDEEGAQQEAPGNTSEEDSLALAMRLMEEEQRMAVQRLQHASYQMALAQMGGAGAGAGGEQDESQALALQLMQEELAGRVGGDQALEGYAEAARAAQEAEVMEQSVVDAAGGGEGGGGADGAVLEERNDGRDYDALLELGARLGDVKSERWAARSGAVVEALPVRTWSAKDAQEAAGTPGARAARASAGGNKKAKKEKPQLSAAVLAALAKAGVGADDSSDEEDGEEGPTCSICMCEFEAGEQVARLPHCGHDFHKDCVATWIRSNNSCPVCKSQVAPSPKQDGQSGQGSAGSASRGAGRDSPAAAVVGVAAGAPRSARALVAPPSASGSAAPGLGVAIAGPASPVSQAGAASNANASGSGSGSAGARTGAGASSSGGARSSSGSSVPRRLAASPPPMAADASREHDDDDSSGVFGRESVGRPSNERGGAGDKRSSSSSGGAGRSPMLGYT